MGFIKLNQKWQPTDREKIFINPTSDRELMSKIYKKKLKKLKTNKPSNPIKIGVQSICDFRGSEPRNSVGVMYNSALSLSNRWTTYLIGICTDVDSKGNS